LVTEEYGGSLLLAGVITTAPLEPDPIAEKNNCNKCKLCVKVCNSGFFSQNEESEPVIIAGQTEIYSKRNMWGRCGIGCSGLTGLSGDGKWSICSPNHISLKNISEDEFKTLEYRTELLKRLLASKETPLNIKQFNSKLLIGFLVGGLFYNVGKRSLENTNPRCGLCSQICVADPKKRKELYDLLRKSGKLYIDNEGKEFIKKVDESGNEIIYYPPTEL